MYVTVNTESYALNRILQSALQDYNQLIYVSKSCSVADQICILYKMGFLNMQYARPTEHLSEFTPYSKANIYAPTLN